MDSSNSLPLDNSNDSSAKILQSSDSTEDKNLAMPVREQKSLKKKTQIMLTPEQLIGSIQYNGLHMRHACSQGNLPLCVLLWGMAAAKRVSLMMPDGEGCNPMHYAAHADTPEVMGFLTQQTRGYLIPNIRLVESRNNAGETPLLRAMMTGRFSVIKALLDEGSDPFVRDNQGNNVFILLSKTGNLWCLHYLYKTIREKHTEQKAQDLLSAVDHEGHNALDWACDTGDVNMIEYLIRQGLSPYHLDGANRGPLYWATKRQRVDACRFLVCLGCNPQQEDYRAQTALSIALNKRNPELVAALKTRAEHVVPLHNVSLMAAGTHARHPRHNNNSNSRGSEQSSYLGDIDIEDIELGTGAVRDHMPRKESDEMSPTANIAPPSPLGAATTAASVDTSSLILLPHPPMYHFGKNCTKLSYAVFRKNQSRARYAAAYAVCIFILWMLTVAMPFWLWLLFTGLVCYGHWKLRSTAEKELAAHNQRNSVRFEQLSANKSVWVEFLCAPERHLGLVLGCFCTYVVFLLVILGDGLSSAQLQGSTAVRYKNSMIEQSTGERGISGGYMQIGATSSYSYDRDLFWLVIMGTLASTVLWVAVAYSDPGSVDTRDDDIIDVLNEGIKCGGEASPQKFCKTLLIRKPIRSKFCSNIGLVVARMDHFCVWLNNAIGYGNHRLFMVFLYVAQATAVLFITMIVRALKHDIGYGGGTTCGVTMHIFSQKYFFAVTLCSFLCITSVGVTALLIEQTINVMNNMTMNERINRNRYPWMIDNDGKHCNKFSKGYLRNFLEFWRFPGYACNYCLVFEIPKIAEDTNKLPATKVAPSIDIMKRVLASSVMEDEKQGHYEADEDYEEDEDDDTFGNMPPIKAAFSMTTASSSHRTYSVCDSGQHN